MAGKQGIAAAKIMRNNPYHGGNKPMIESYPQDGRGGLAVKYPERN